ncbi:glycosyltransferase [Pedobacter gandavensis]|uniref:glycosyltransferase n=1 Tax=Pedobacter gandavensis TaxID=2679963 RepID=UPI00292F53D3|nr:glycosyltransferase [Pedobacter gandavensis]
MRKLKLFFVINSLTSGGAERVVTNLANYFYREGFNVTMICLNYKEPVYAIDDGMRLIYLTNRAEKDSLPYRIWFAMVTFFKLLSLLIKEKPTTVISFMTSANLWAGLTCSLTRTPFIVSERTTPDNTIHKFNSFLKWIYFQVYRKSKAIVVPAKAIEGCLKKNKSFQKLNNFYLIKNYVNVFQPVGLEQVHYKKFILGVGRLSYEKGFDQLIDAYSKINIPEVDLIIAGDGNERELLMEKIKNLGLSNSVRLIGARENLQDYYQQAELFVLPSRNEGYPNALIEAMSMGCPSIAMDCEFGPAEIIETGKNGILVEDRNIGMLAESMLEVLNDSEFQRKLSKSGKMINQTNSQELITSKWQELILS